MEYDGTDNERAILLVAVAVLELLANRPGGFSGSCETKMLVLDVRRGPNEETYPVA